MSEIRHANLQPHEKGRYVARRRDEVVIEAESFDELLDRLDGAKIDPGELVIEYIEPAGIVCVY